MALGIGPGDDELREKRGAWTSEGAFIYSMAAASVGLGNLWRFPYIAGEQGGAAFVLAYLICLVAIGLPLMFMELGFSRAAVGGPVRAMRSAHRWGVLVGWATIVVTTAITSYYLVVTGWTFGYALDALRGAPQDFEDFTAGFAPVWYFGAVTLLCAAVLVRGLAAIERFSRYMMPALLVAVVGLVIAGLFSDGRGEAAAFLLTPDFSRLASPTLWLFAIGQVFYGLAIGQGYLLTYGSFISPGVHIPRAATIVAMVDMSVALLAGWMIFPVVFAQGLEPTTGSDLAFTTLPRAFEGIDAGGIFAGVFFPLLFLAAFSSSIAGMKVLTVTLRDEFQFSLPRAVVTVAGAMLVLGLPSALSYSRVDLAIAGEPVLDLVDRLGGTYVVVILGVVTGAVISWAARRRRGLHFRGRVSGRTEWYVTRIGRLLPLFAVPLLMAALVW